MTVDKEAILMSYIEQHNATVNDMHKFKLNKQEISMFCQAMESYSLKENEELKKDLIEARHHFDVMVGADNRNELRIEELKSSLSSIEKAYEIMRDKSERLEKELLAAKNLIWKAFYLSVCDLPDDEQLKYWQEFKTENNLTEKLPQRVIE